MQPPTQITTDVQGASVAPTSRDEVRPVNPTTAAYGSWPVMPGLHKPTAVRPTLSPETLAAYGQANYDSMNERFLDVLQLLGLSGYRVAKEGPVSRATIANIRAGRNQPGSELLCWLATVYPQVNLDYLLRKEGDPIAPLVPTVGPSIRLDDEQLPERFNQLLERVDVLRDRLHEEVYPALFDEANLLYENGEIVTLSAQALAINLHREFVEALGPHQADWWDSYWHELGVLFDRAFGYEDGRANLFTDRTFLQLLHSFAS
ncbi:helix-turn-helix domain-containing protein [Fibrella sp. ES10-3-2-2]|nr:hypothetical protein A6C57_06985 [Fibrella sp. ES10-3-2-2]